MLLSPSPLFSALLCFWVGRLQRQGWDLGSFHLITVHFEVTLTPASTCWSYELDDGNIVVGRLSDDRKPVSQSQLCRRISCLEALWRRKAQGVGCCCWTAGILVADPIPCSAQAQCIL